jgi:SH3-like domain-containing protein
MEVTMRWATGYVFLAAAVLASRVCGADTGRMSVQLKEAQLRADPSFLGAVVKTLPYGTPVSVVLENAGWSKVLTEDRQTGWIHSSGLSKRTVTLAGAQEAQTSASSGELALAGKGFNSKVEAEFKTQNAAIDFAWVDRMEKTRISPDEIADFAKAGGLQFGTGGEK